MFGQILVKYANVDTIDLADYDRPGGKERLAQQLRQNVHQLGMTHPSYRWVEREIDSKKASFTSPTSAFRNKRLINNLPSPKYSSNSPKKSDSDTGLPWRKVTIMVIDRSDL